MFKVSKCALAALLSSTLAGTLAGCANERQSASYGPISQSDTMMEEAAAMLSAPNFNEGLARQIAVRQRNQRINAQLGTQ